jgi:GNAT superfamily N-acetyltransferase
MDIRSALPGEVESLARLWSDGWQDAHADILPAKLARHRTEASFRERLRAALPSVRVAGPPGGPVGLCMVKGDELNQLYVSAIARGSGAAAALLADAESRIAAAGITTAWLTCAIGNERAARFYEKSGWRRAGNMINQLETPAGVFPLEVWRYEKRIGGGRADLIIQIKKKTDGTAALTCRRPDGSVTWQRQEGQHALFFPLHDLTHYAVESVLGYRNGFFGLVADGWDFSDFGHPWRRGRLPTEAGLAEFIVGFLDLERASGMESSIAELREAAATFGKQNGVDINLPITEDELRRIREMRRNLFAQWVAVPAGESLDLHFVL